MNAIALHNIEILLTIMKYCSDAVYTINPDQTYGVVNDTFSKILNVDSEAINGKNPYDLFPAHEAEERINIYKHVFATGITHSSKVTFTDSANKKRFFQITVAPVKDANGEIVSLLSIARDVTDAMGNAQKLAAEKLFTETVMETIPGLFYVFNDNGDLIRCNQKFTELLGYKAINIAQIDPLEIVNNRDDIERVKNVIQEVFSTGYNQMEVVLKNRWYKLINKRFSINDDVFFIGVGVDITDQKNATASLENYLDAINHDLRNPLSSIISFSGILCEEEATEDETRKFAQMIYEAGVTMSDLMESYLLLTKIENGNFNIALNSIKISNLINDIKRTFLANKYSGKVRFLVRNIEGSLLSIDFLEKQISVNKNLIISLLTNLINNAVEAIGDSGNKVIVNIFENEGLDISITNDGVIPQYIQEKMFQKYNSNKKKGNGIGLYSAKIIAKAHGGDVEYQALPDATRFIVKLPF